MHGMEKEIQLKEAYVEGCQQKLEAHAKKTESPKDSRG